jgi:imidazolonepropionase-like amidohydrolase
VNRIVFVNGQVFDGTGTPAAPGDVVVRGDRIESVRAGGGTPVEPGDQVVDCTGATVMPGLVESHSHLTFPSAVGHINPSFNPALDVSFFHHMPTPDEHLAIARRNAKILLDQGFTSAYSAGSLTPVPTEVRLREEIAGGPAAGRARRGRARPGPAGQPGGACAGRRAADLAHARGRGRHGAGRAEHPAGRGAA